MKFAEWKYALGVYLVARIALSMWAFIITMLFPIVVQNLDLFGAPVLAVFDLASSERYAYSREVDDAVLTFRVGDPGFVNDTQTASTWSLQTGRAVSGKYAERALSASPYSIEDIFPYRGIAAEGNMLLSVWQRFDTNWYLAIADRGYGTLAGDVHFPPLYPALIRLTSLIVPNALLSALLISNLALIGALRVYFQCVREQFDPTVPQRAVACLLIFPTAFFLLSAYSESLFLLLSLLSFRAMQRQLWLWAGMWIFLAILTRLQGVALLVPLAYALWRTRPFTHRGTRFVSAALAMSAILFYLVVRVLTGASAVVPVAEAELRARLALPVENYWYAVQTFASGKFVAVDALNFVVSALVVIALGIGWRKLPLLWNLYLLASVFVLTMRIVETQPLNSMLRYVLGLFPWFVLLGIWSRNIWIQRAIVYSSLTLLLYLSAQFVMWGWVG